ncbi:[PSI+] induction protein 2 [Yarrowia sp. E02]|nr:[PSI+] induction protein 2 [Yarrowia sp. E02]
MAPMIPLCPQAMAQPLVSLTKRGLAESAKSTGEAFKSWDSCMDNTFCKIVAIVGIVAAGMLVLWILTAFFRCCFYGASAMTACCAICSCCACCCNDKVNREANQGNYAAANNPAMYPASNPYQAYNYQPQPVYGNQSNNNFAPDYYVNRRSDEDDFEMKKYPRTNVYEVPADQDRPRY